MLLTAIDVGSNSIRMLTAELSAGRIYPVRYERVITRLAAGIDETGCLGQSAMKETLKALRCFSEIIKGYGAGYVKSVGTSALREAKNSEEFLNLIQSGTGIKTEVVSGQKEAELTAKGVLLSIETPVSLIADIGGGSTEWMICNRRKILKSGTVPVGVVKLLDRHVKSDPPLSDDVRCLEAEAEEVSETIKARVITHITSDTVMIGTAGTATTLASMELGLETYDPEKIHMHEISLGRLLEFSGILTSLPLKERAKIKGLEPERADLIIPGIVLTIKLMEALGFGSIFISAHGLLEGILLELSREVLRNVI